MPRQLSASVENHFIGGLKTEFTGLNFPENACTDTDNCVFSVVGEVSRRGGIDFELNSTASINVNTYLKAQSSYKWNNAGGDGETQLFVQQIGSKIYFYLSSSATVASPLSHKRLPTVTELNTFTTGAGAVEEIECQYADGNGYLFIYHPYCAPVYCTYNPMTGVVEANTISVQIRDFNGINEALAVNQRPGTLTAQHQYNLNNQGWTQGSAWASQDTTHAPFTSPAYTPPLSTGSHVFTIDAGLPITNGDTIQVFASSADPSGIINTSIPIMTGSVTSYVGTSLTLNVFTIQTIPSVDSPISISGPFIFNPIGLGYVNTWFTDIGNYPSNADIWWRFKNTSDVFDPATTNINVTLNTGPAPKGHYIIDAFNQQRDLVSGINGLTDVFTPIRPKTGAWFQGRIWYAGVDASQVATGDQLHYSWSENIYFSQVVENVSQLGNCYQNNDPTSEDFFDLLPTDGGVIRIQGSGSIFKLFPIQNGMLVFAGNGIWFITGSQGIGFSANDYTVTKISSVQTISSTSFVNVLGFPLFWAEEGIYSVTPSQQGGGLTVDNICINTIASFYDDIPKISKRFARGDFNPITYVVTWLFRSTNEDDLTSRYIFNRALNLNTSSKAFYPWTFVGEGRIHDVKYISSPGGSTAPDPVFKYITSFSEGQFITFSEERDFTNYVDFSSNTGGEENFISYFVSGFKLHGQALRRWQPGYIYMFNNSPGEVISYKIQGIWDWSNNPNSGRYSSIQKVSNITPNYGVLYHRHKIRGNGLSLQLKVISVDGAPFQMIGWSMSESSNAGV